MGERSRLQADLESTQAALKAKGNVKVLYVMYYQSFSARKGGQVSIAHSTSHITVAYILISFTSCACVSFKS